MKKIALLSMLMVAVAGTAMASWRASASVYVGPIGFVGAIMAFVAAAVLAIRQMVLPAVGTILAGVFLLKADTLVAGLGAMIG